MLSEIKKPTVGILSMQRVINYGSFLQAYALKQLLLENGAADVFFIDIIPGRILVKDSIASKNIGIRYALKLWELTKSQKIFSKLKTLIFQKKVAKSIKYAWQLLELEKKPLTTLDLVVIGSDEVFNCCQDVTWGYSTQLFGDIASSITHKVVSYAGSFGYTTLNNLVLYSIDSEIANNLKKLAAISVRDENSANIVQKLTGQTPHIHIDPVLAYGYETEIKNFRERPTPANYMIIYFYQDRLTDTKTIKAINKYSKINNLKLISIYCRYDWCDVAVIPDSPLEVLRWFKFADCIVTDTFHGTIFSIITQSRFSSFIQDTNKNKLHYLLKVLHLEDRETNVDSLSTILNIPPDYSYCNTILSNEREKTHRYIKNCLS